MVKLGIIDYGSGNFRSVCNAYAFLGIDYREVTSPGDLDNVSHIVLPGVGAFAATMKRLKGLGFIDGLNEHVVHQQKSYLGICVGMQILASEGTEFETCEGLGFIPGLVKKIQPGAGLNLPHIGWNSVIRSADTPLLNGIVDDCSFYFVNSYQLIPDDSFHAVAYADYGEKVTAIVQKGNIYGVQFHPEKSQLNGLELLRSFSCDKLEDSVAANG